jgi:hypothetical protein
MMKIVFSIILLLLQLPLWAQTPTCIREGQACVYGASATDYWTAADPSTISIMSSNGVCRKVTMTAAAKRIFIPLTIPGWMSFVNFTPGPEILTASACPPTGGCPAGAPTWSSCSGPLAPAADGGSSSVTNTVLGFTGSATYSCSGTTWTIQSGSTCIPSLACPTGDQPWLTKCLGTVNGVASGSTSSPVANTKPAFTGTATFLCTNGVWSVNGTPTCVPSCSGNTWAIFDNDPIDGCVSPPNFDKRIVNVTRGGFIGGNFASSNQATIYITGTPDDCCLNDESNYCLGTARRGFQCVAPTTGCTAGPQTWGSCSGSVTAVASGSPSTAVNTNPGFTGSATFDCSGTTWTVRAGSSCNPTPSSNCPGNGDCSYYLGSYAADNCSNPAAGPLTPSTTSYSSCMGGCGCGGNKYECSFECTSCPSGKISDGVGGCKLAGASCTQGHPIGWSEGIYECREYNSPPGPFPAWETIPDGETKTYDPHYCRDTSSGDYPADCGGSIQVKCTNGVASQPSIPTCSAGGPI